MGFSPCEREDPFTRKVRDAYRANVVRAPSTGIAPLDVLAVGARRRVEPRGRLDAMLSGAAPSLPRPTSVEVADLRGQRSTTLDLSVGADLTAAFLGALGLPVPGAEVGGHVVGGCRGCRSRSATSSSAGSTSPASAARSPVAGCAQRRHRGVLRRAQSTDAGDHAHAEQRLLRGARHGSQRAVGQGRGERPRRDLGEVTADAGWSVEGASTIAFREGPGHVRVRRSAVRPAPRRHGGIRSRGDRQRRSVPVRPWSRGNARPSTTPAW